MPDEKRVDERVKHFAYVAPRKPDADGDTEVLDGVTFTHHFVDAPGDAETIRWHYTEAGSGEPIVFLHGIPPSDEALQFASKFHLPNLLHDRGPVMSRAGIRRGNILRVEG